MKVLAKIYFNSNLVILYGIDRSNCPIHISSLYGQVQYINTFWGRNGKQWVLGVGEESNIHFVDLIQKGD